MRAALVALAAAGALASCRPSQPAPERPGRPAAEADYPALRWVPADVSFALATPRVSDAAALFAEAIRPLALAGGETSDEIEGDLRSFFGVSLVDGSALADIGIDVDGSAAVFGGAAAQTLVAPVASPERLEAFFGDQRPEVGVGVTQVRGADVYAWHLPGGDRMAWAIHGGWLLVHRDRERAGHAWLERALDVPGGAGLAGEPDFRRALERSRAVLGAVNGRRPTIVGVVRTPRLARELVELAGDELAPCLAGPAIAAPTLIVGAAGGWDFGDVFVEAELSAAAAGELAGAVADAPPPGYLSLRDGAGLAVDWALDTRWLERAAGANPCLAAANVVDPFARIGWMPPPKSAHVVASGLDLSGPAGQVALHVALESRAFVDRQLDAIPMRSFFERGATVAGQPVRVLGVPSYPEIYYRLTGDSLSAALGRAWMERLLSPGNAAAGPRELVAIALRPDRVGDLEGLFGALDTALMGYQPAGAARARAEALRRYEIARARLVLDGPRLRLRARMRLDH